jgi:hypothetical protein
MIATSSLNCPTVPVLQTSPMLQPGAMSAGAPIILTPRLPHLTSVASLPSPATANMFNSVATAGLVSATETTPASYMYQYDPFVQRMFEYSAAMEPSSAGKPTRKYFSCGFHVLKNKKNSSPVSAGKVRCVCRSSILIAVGYGNKMK